MRGQELEEEVAPAELADERLARARRARPPRAARGSRSGGRGSAARWRWRRGRRRAPRRLAADRRGSARGGFGPPSRRRGAAPASRLTQVGQPPEVDAVREPDPRRLEHRAPPRLPPGPPVGREDPVVAAARRQHLARVDDGQRGKHAHVQLLAQAALAPPRERAGVLGEVHRSGLDLLRQSDRLGHGLPAAQGQTTERVAQILSASPRKASRLEAPKQPRMVSSRTKSEARARPPPPRRRAPGCREPSGRA